MTYEKTKFFPMIRKIGLKRFIIDPEFYIALILGTILTIFVFLSQSISVLMKTLFPYYISISLTMFTIALAGLAIIASFSSDNFILKIKKCFNETYKNSKEDPLENILFFYYYSTIVSSICIITTLISYLFIKLNANLYVPWVSINIDYFFFWLPTFLVFYSLFSVMTLVGTTMRFGIYRGRNIDKEN